MKKKKHYGAYNICKSTIDLIHANLKIAPECKLSKEYDLKGSDHFPIIIEDDRKSLPNNKRHGV